MDSANLVALVSVIVTGVFAPAIAALTTRWQFMRTIKLAADNDSRSILDDAAKELARFRRANGHCIALWRRGVPDNGDESIETLKARSLAAEGVAAIYGRLCIRFGPESEIASTFQEINKQIDKAHALLEDYRQGQSFAGHEEKAAAAENELARADATFFAVAHRVRYKR